MSLVENRSEVIFLTISNIRLETIKRVLTFYEIQSIFEPKIENLSRLFLRPKSILTIFCVFKSLLSRFSKRKVDFKLFLKA